VRFIGFGLLQTLKIVPMNNGQTSPRLTRKIIGVIRHGGDGNPFAARLGSQIPVPKT
jgi:hypothetical protein